MIREFDTTLSLKAGRERLSEMQTYIDTKVAMKEDMNKKTTKNKENVAKIILEQGELRKLVNSSFKVMEKDMKMQVLKVVQG
jgi:hypothetical protein